MTIKEAQSLSDRILLKLGFPQEEVYCITQNLIEAELAERKTHGLIRLLAIADKVNSGSINIRKDEIETISERMCTIHFDGKYKTGFYVIYKSFEKSFEKVKQTGMLGVGLRNLSYASGYIGDYARRATEQNLIFIGFHNSPGGLVPFGAIKDLWGTNPITVGIPTHDLPVILDMASSSTTWGDVMIAKNEGKQLEEGVAIDEEGNITTDPEKAMLGGILPIAGHKGSGLAFIVELLSGALTHSRVGGAVEGGWGSFYILIDPSCFRDLKDFKDDVGKAIDELKSAPKAKGINEIYFPGEQSGSKRQKSLERDQIEISDKLLAKLNLLE